MNQWNPGIVRGYNARSIGRVLQDLKNKGLSIRVHRTAQDRTWYIPIHLGMTSDEAHEGSDDYNIIPMSPEDIEAFNLRAAQKEVKPGDVR
jgi:hypothetical protein